MALFSTLGDGATVTFLGTLGSETGVDTLSGRGLLNMAASFLMTLICLVPHFGDLDSIRLLEKSDNSRCGLYGHNVNHPTSQVSGYYPDL